MIEKMKFTVQGVTKNEYMSGDAQITIGQVHLVLVPFSAGNPGGEVSGSISLSNLTAEQLGAFKMGQVYEFAFTPARP